MIAGNFDVIHPGNIFLFNECKENCDHLVLFLHDDPSIEISSPNFYNMDHHFKPYVLSFESSDHL